MAKPSAADRIVHIIEAISQFELATAGMDARIFEATRFVRLGVERCIEIISEAVRHIPDDVKAQQAHIPGAASPTSAIAFVMPITPSMLSLYGPSPRRNWSF